MSLFAFSLVKNNTKRNTSKKLQRAGMLVAAFVVMGSLVAPVAFAAPGDISWTPIAPTTVSTGLNPAWRAAAMSSDGSKLAVVNHYSGYIYTSADSGTTWIERTSAGLRSWESITSSADGSKLVAVEGGGFIYTSTDSGANWTVRMDDISSSWSSIASSADGSKLVAVSDDLDYETYQYVGKVYTSTDSGATWTQQSAPALQWSSVASSADGSRIAAAVNGGSIYTSSDFGATWTEQTAAPSDSWVSITMSDDGKTLVAGVDWGYVYVSRDYGVTWAEQTSLGQAYWYALDVSGDGKKNGCCQ